MKQKGALGWVAIPNMVIFQILLPLVSPFIDIMFVVGAVTYFVDKYRHPESANPADFHKLVVYFALFMVIDFIASTIAFTLERQQPGGKRDFLLLGHVWLQRFAYRQLFSLVLIKTLKRAIEGRGFAWDKLERTASVRQPVAVRAARGGAMSPAPKPALDMSVNVAGIELKNPILAASGSFGYGVEFEDVVTLSRLGGFVTKGLSREPMAGNPPPRLFETAAGMLNAIGLQNIGARAFLEEKLPLLRKIEQHRFLLQRLRTFAGRVRRSGAHSQRRRRHRRLRAERLLPQHQVRRHRLRQRSQDAVRRGQRGQEDCHAAADREALAQCHQHSGDGARRRRSRRRCDLAGQHFRRPWRSMPRRASRASRTSPPDSRARRSSPSPLRMVWEAAKTVKIPIIGLGGISTAEDVIEFMLAGASAIEVGTVNFWDPCACETLVDSLEKWCLEHRIEKISELTGGLKLE